MMKKPRKKSNNDLLVMSKGERTGVISLLTVIAVLMAFSLFRPVLRFSKSDGQAFHNLDSMIALQEREAQQRQAEEAQRIAERNATAEHQAEKASGTNYGKNSGKNSGNISRTDSRKATESTSKSSWTTSTTTERKAIPILDLNATDSLELVALPQIGEVMASRIHRYRERLGGFVSLDQLYEVKGMDSARFATIKPYLLLEDPTVRKIDVNRDDFKTLLRHPYLDYDQVKAIVNYRERRGFIRDWEQLRSCIGEVEPLLREYVGF